MADVLNPLNANPTKWSYILKQSVLQKPTNCLSGFDHSVGLALNPKKAGGVNLTPPPLHTPLWFFQTFAFHNIISHIFSENFIEIPLVVQKI